MPLDEAVEGDPGDGWEAWGTVVLANGYLQLSHRRRSYVRSLYNDYRGSRVLAIFSDEVVYLS